MIVPSILKPLYKIHHSDKINRRVWLPGKMLWRPCYQLHKYPFEDNECYTVILMNGSLRYNFSEQYFLKLKEEHPNIKQVMILYDSFINKAASRSISMIPIFDCIFSFDKNDCEKYGFERIYSTFSTPSYVYKDRKISTNAFFVGYGAGRLKLLLDSFEVIGNNIENCFFSVCGVQEKDKKNIPGVVYNRTMPYSDELQMAYNTKCIVEIIKEGQVGISLRTCEAVSFNKKLITNNKQITNMPFYYERYMRVFTKPEEIDLDFLLTDIDVKYERDDYFSPIRIIERLEQINKSETKESS